MISPISVWIKQQGLHDITRQVAAVVNKAQLIARSLYTAYFGKPFDTGKF